MDFKTKIIEFYGLPKTGKTTSANALQKYIVRDLGKKSILVIERAGVCPIKDKLHPSFNYWTVISFAKEYLQANDAGYDYIIADRGILDAYVWVHYLARRISDLQYESSFKELAFQKFLIDNCLLSFYFTASESTILEREYSRIVNKGSGKTSRIMNHEVLSEYSKSYSEISETLKELCFTKVIDTTNTTDRDITNMVNSVAEEFIKHTTQQLDTV